MAYHTLGKQISTELKKKQEAEGEEADKDFRARLNFFARASQNYVQRLRAYLAKVPLPQLTKEENKVKKVALACTTNVCTLIRDLYHSPPIYKAKITLSWRSEPNNKVVKLFKTLCVRTFEFIPQSRLLVNLCVCSFTVWGS